MFYSAVWYDYTKLTHKHTIHFSTYSRRHRLQSPDHFHCHDVSRGPSVAPILHNERDKGKMRVIIGLLRKAGFPRWTGAAQVPFEAKDCHVSSSTINIEGKPTGENWRSLTPPSAKTAAVCVSHTSVKLGGVHPGSGSPRRPFRSPESRPLRICPPV